MASVQTNIRLPTDIKAWLQSKAKEDGRTKGEVLARIIRPLMEFKPPEFHRLSRLDVEDSEGQKFMRAKTTTRIDLDGNEYQTPCGDAHTQQSLIPKLGKDHGFAGFWNAYPKKKAKAEALKAWIKNDCFKIAVNIITDVNDRVSHDPSWSDKQFIPNGATYLNGKRWEDEIIQQDNRPAFEKQGDALRDELFGNDGATYEHE